MHFQEGETVAIESPGVIGPKQTSPLVCVECFKQSQIEELR